MTMLSLEGASVRFGARAVLDGVGLDVAEHEIVCARAEREREVDAAAGGCRASAVGRGAGVAGRAGSCRGARAQAGSG